MIVEISSNIKIYVLSMKVLSLSSGRNGSGLSAAIATEQLLNNSMESSLYALCLVNVGDSVQKHCMDRGIKLRLLKCILITSLSPHCISGLAGIILSCSTCGLADLTIIGPPGLQRYMSAISPFVKKQYPVCNIIEVSKGDSYQVSELGIRMHIEYSPLYDDCNVNSVCYSIIENYRRNIKVTNKSNTFGIISSTGELKVDDEPRVCLLAVFMPISLYDDNSRILEIIHGIVTQISKMYIVVPSTPPCVSMGCLVLVPYQCVSTNNSPLCSKLWLRVFDICCSKNLMWKIEYVIVCDLCLMDDVVEFNTAQKSVMLHQSLTPSLFPNCLSILRSLEMSSVFCCLKEENEVKFYRSLPMLTVFCCISDTGELEFSIAWESNLSDITEELDHKLSMCGKRADANTAFNQNEATSSNASSTPNVEVVSNRNVAMEMRKKLKIRKLGSAPTALTQITDIPFWPPPPPRPPPPPIPPPPPANISVSVCTLGTGCATPSKYRNNLSILLQQCDNEPSLVMSSSKQQCALLLDVGEGVSVQLFYHCSGNSQLYFEKLVNIDVIWISHHHADHLMGISMLMEQIRRARIVTENTDRKKVLIIGSVSVVNYVEAVLKLCGLDNLVEYQPITMTLSGANILSNARISACSRGMVKELISYPVFHCPMAFGVILCLNNGLKVVFSGDCRPVIDSNKPSNIDIGTNTEYGSERKSNHILLRYAMNCDLLIHEATFDNSMSDDAVKKKHSTISEAIYVGNALKAKSVLLTHFSQRYPKVMGLTEKPKNNQSDVVHESGLVGDENSIFSFDLMEIKIAKQYSVKNKRLVDNLISALQLIENSA